MARPHRTRPGRKPTPEHLTPADADARLREILAEAGRSPAKPIKRPVTVTYGDACAEWLRYVEHDRPRAASTVRDYGNTVRRYLLPAFGADTPVVEVTTEGIDAYRELELLRGRLSRRTLQKIPVINHGILTRATARAGSPRTRPPAPSASSSRAPATAPSCPPPRSKPSPAWRGRREGC